MGKSEQRSEEAVPGISPQSEASKMLEAALMQMDGIISGTSTRISENGNTSSVPGIKAAGVVGTSGILTLQDAAQQLAAILQSTPPKSTPPPDNDIRDLLLQWLQTNPDQDGKVQRLESEKESLQMQVSVLSEQIEAQTDKISELEKTLLEKKQLLGNTEELLQREMLSRSSLETQKLELMSAMSELKLQQAALERENIELRTSHYNNNPLGNHIQQSSARKPLLSRTSPVPQHTSTPVHASQLTGNTMSPSSSCLVSNSSLGGPSPIRTDGMQTHHEISQPRTPPASFRRTVDIRYGSLPRQAFPTNGRVDSNANQQQQSATLGPKKGVVFGRGFTALLGGGKIRGQSVPNLGDSNRENTFYACECR